MASPTRARFGGASRIIPFAGRLGCIGVGGFALNLVVVVVLTAAFRALNVPTGTDRTVAADYVAEAEHPSGTGTTAPADVPPHTGLRLAPSAPSS